MMGISFFPHFILSMALSISVGLLRSSGGIADAAINPALTPHKAYSNIIYFAPHPDDEALYAATLFRALSQGANITVAYMSDGESPDLMAKGYLQGRFSPLPPTAAERIEAYHGIRRQEARESMGVLAQLSGRGLRQEFLGLASIAGAFADEGARLREKRRLRAILDRHLQGDQIVAIYMPHPLDTHPGHRATFDFIRDLLRDLPPEKAFRVRTFAYMVHFGRYAGTLGLSSLDSTDLSPYQFAFRKDNLETTVPTDLELVVKTESLLAHATQMERDDLLHYGSPFFAGYLSGFLSIPETVEKIDCFDYRLPEPRRRNLVLRGQEILYRHVQSLRPLLRPQLIFQRDRDLRYLQLRARQFLGESSRTFRELRRARSANLKLFRGALCAQALLHSHPFK